MTRSRGWPVLAAVLPVWLLAAPAIQAQEQGDPKPPADEEDRARGTFRWRRHPSLRFGRVLRVDFRAKLQFDFRDFTPAQRDHGEELFEIHRARVGVEGRFLNDFEYEVEYDLVQDKFPWRDAYVNYRRFRKAQIRAGKFKIPFGLEQLTGPANLDFALRTGLSRYLAPARSIGAEVHGRFFSRGLNYQVGFFRHDGENAFDNDDKPTGQRTFAARLTGTPLRLLPLPGILKSMEIGQAFTESPVPEGLKGVEGRTAGRKTFFEHYFVRGHRMRLGSELRWAPGPFSIQGEFVHVRDQRLGQAISGQDLPDLIARAWYVLGTWVVTGEKKAGGVEPRRAFLTERGVGAIELAGRYEQLRFGSAQHPGRPTRSTRGANLVSASDRIWTVGLNWYLNPWTKVQVNAIRDHLEDRLRFPQEGRPNYWVKLLRLQVVL